MLIENLTLAFPSHSIAPVDRTHTYHSRTVRNIALVVSHVTPQTTLPDAMEPGLQSHLDLGLAFLLGACIPVTNAPRKTL